ncbi:MAG TPA: ABC transporter substrate-binding protein [Streptosporangiaceae bacterium]|nr:ABC transporter substrate-binding protein [Streptosporangiaceae bacterium]
MRRPRARTARLAATTILTAATVAACGGLNNAGATGSAANAGPSGPPITVGMSLSLTGGFSADGQACLKGYELWRDDVNSHGGLLGRPVKLVYLNDNSDPATTTKAYTTLAQEHVDLLLGPFSSLLTVPAGIVANKFHYAFVEGSGGAPKVFQQKLPDLFGVSAPVQQQMLPFARWAAALPAGNAPGDRPKTAAYAMVDDPFADPPVLAAKAILQKAGVATVYDNYPGPGNTGAKLYEPNANTGAVPTSVLISAADKIASLNPQAVLIGSVDVPTLAAFINEFRRRHYSPQILIAASGPDQGQIFLNAIGTPNANGIMVPDGWYGGYPDALSHVMVQEYIATYGGTASDINADVAEAYSAGQVMADAVTSVGLNQQKIINYLHNPNITLDTVQGPASWDKYVPGKQSGVNTKAVSFIFQWKPGARFEQVLANTGPAVGIINPKKMWASF